MHWILIFIFWSGTGVATSSTPFDTQAACQSAAAHLQRDFPREAHAYCEPSQ